MQKSAATRRRLLQASFKQSKSLIGVGVVAMLCAFIVMVQWANALQVVLWLILMSATYFGQYALDQSYIADPSRHSDEHWAAFRTAIYLLLSILWTSLALFFDPQWPIALRVAIAVFLPSVFLLLMLSTFLSLATTLAVAGPILMFSVFVLTSNPDVINAGVGSATLVVTLLLGAAIYGINRFVVNQAESLQGALNLVERARNQITKFSGESKLAQFALNKQQGITRVKDAMIQMAAESLILLDSNGTIIDANLSAAELFRRRRRDIVGLSVDTFLIAVESGSPVSKHHDIQLRSTPNKTDDLRVEVMLLRVDGSGIFVEIHSSPIEVNDQRYTRISLNDVTDRRRVQMRLQESETRYRTLFDNNPSICITLSPTGYILDINTTGAQHLGFNSSLELKAKLLSNLLPQGDRSKVIRYLRQATLQPGQAYRFEHSVVGANGQTLRVSASAVAIRSGSELQLLLVWEDITETDELNRKLRWQASHDSLTGLFNRQAMEQQLQVLIDEGKPDQQHSYCLIDLDRFKMVNDTAGHPAGDELLRQIAKLMASCLRDRDVLARIGGDEFSVILIDCPPAQAEEIAERLRDVVDQFRFVWNESSFRIGLSIGLVSFEPNAWDLERILTCADAACYVAKDKGKNRVEIFEASEHQHDLRETEEVQSATALSQRIQDGRLSLMAQVIHPLNDQDRPRLELLVRMRNDNGELLSPGSFMGALERFNIITELDRWVVEEALDWIGANLDQLSAVDSVAINLSSRALTELQFESFLLEALSKRPELASYLVIELQENAVVQNLTRSNEFIDLFTPLGLRFAVDDFGAGLSAFDFLKSERFSYIKIDGRFTGQLDQDPYAQAIVKSIHEVAGLLKLQTVAEAVEDEGALQWLEAHDITYAQGFCLSRPELPSEALARAAAK